ncbi:hypothetical protein [Lacinutrix sp. MEBiC02404]
MSQIINVVMLCALPFLIVKNKKIEFNFGSKYFNFFLLYTFLSTLVISLFFIDSFLELGGFFRSEGRFLSQLILLFLNFSIVPLAVLYLKNISHLKKCFKVYISSLLLLSFLGLLQFVVYLVFNLDLFPLSIDNYGDIRSGIYGFADTNFFRISSLGGEPKGFSISLVLGFFVIHVFNRYQISFFKYDVYIKYLFLFLAFATVSTSALVLFFILVIVYALFPKQNIGKKLKSNNVLILFGFCAVLFFCFYYFDILLTVFQERILDRDVVKEDFDAPILLFFKSYPEYLFFGSGIGNIHHLSYSFIPVEYLHYMKDSIFSSKSGYLKLISEYGFFGSIIFLSLVGNIFLKLRTVSRKLNFVQSKYFYAMQLLLIICFIAYLARVYLYTELILLLAITNALAFNQKFIS